MRAYRDALQDHEDLCQEAVVLDLTSTVGAVGFYAVFAGARKIYVIVKDIEEEHSATSQAVINGLDDGTVSIVEARRVCMIKDEDIPEKCDLILSDWMGGCLFSKSTLNALLWARERLLAQDGVVFPSSVSLNICGIQDPDGKLFHADWANQMLHGIDFSEFRSVIKIDRYQSA